LARKLAFGFHAGIRIFLLVGSGKLNALEDQSNVHVWDPDKQARFVKVVLLQGDDWEVMKKFEYP
jgi:hypothetical protein